MSLARILICSPIRQKPHILEAFLTSLDRLTHDSFEIDHLFIDDNEDARSSELLDEFDRGHPDRVRIIDVDADADERYVCDDATHRWRKTLVRKVANFKNAMIDTAIQEGYDYIFFIDSDLVVHPYLLEHLYALRKELVCEIFWTQWKPGGMEMPNVWMFDSYELAPQAFEEELTEQERDRRARAFLKALRTPGLYEVGGLGACTLIARSALCKGVNFSPIPNLSFWGEDRFFCVRAAVLGIPLIVDTHYPAYHIYRDGNLPGAYAYMKTTEKGSAVACRTQVGSF